VSVATAPAFASILPVLGSAGIASNVDSLSRPFVYERVSNIPSMITPAGAFYREEYGVPDRTCASHRRHVHPVACRMTSTGIRLSFS